MKKRDFLAGMCCGAFIARAIELELSNVSQIITVALVVFALSSLWEWIKNATTKVASRNIAMKRLPKYS
jgi:uncharacterized membrane protein